MRTRNFAAALLLLLFSVMASVSPTRAQVPWKNALRQSAEWYKTGEATRIADNVLLYQHDNGGWKKNIDMAAPLEPGPKAEVIEEKVDAGTTIDNGATYTQMAFLARVYNANRNEAYKTAFLKGLDYLLAAQYPNGGWPQYYPPRKGYYTHITFNDDAMIGVLDLLRAVTRKAPEYAFVDDARRARCAAAITKGIDCILKCQVVVSGKPTVWCAQHDEKTFAPAPARAYELISLSGGESVGITRFLMGIDKPSPQVIRAIENAMAWFDAAKLTGIRVALKPAPGTPKGVDRTVVSDPAAPPMWARFYEIGTNRPIFSDRDGVPKRTLAEIGYERRNGYNWLSYWPATLLDKDYPAWKAANKAP